MLSTNSLPAWHCAGHQGCTEDEGLKMLLQRHVSQRGWLGTQNLS